MLLKIDGYEFSELQSYLIINEVLSSTEIENQEGVVEYLKYHKIEEFHCNIILRNPDFNSMHFAVEKDI